jgi:signal transduction histidine kinase
MRSLAESRCVTLDFDLESAGRLRCYPAKLNLMVQNLVSNAIDACRAGDKVVIRARQADDVFEIDVVDTGCGIDPAIRDRVFDPFFTTKPIDKGTGLGLSMSYGVIKDHGGTIDFESSPARGFDSSSGYQRHHFGNWRRLSAARSSRLRDGAETGQASPARVPQAAPMSLPPE